MPRTLAHSSLKTSQLKYLGGLILFMALKDRIQAVIDAGFTRTQIAKAAKKSQSAVTQWLSGDTKDLKSDSAAGIQVATGFSAVWLATVSFLTA